MKIEEHRMENQLPEHIEQDLVAGFTLTDPDDGFQRCKKISQTKYLFRCDVNGEVFEEEIDTDTIDKIEAIDGYYDSIAEVSEIYANYNANMIIAECHFEKICPMEIPT